MDLRSSHHTKAKRSLNRHSRLSLRRILHKLWRRSPSRLTSSQRFAQREPEDKSEPFSKRKSNLNNLNNLNNNNLNNLNNLNLNLNLNPNLNLNLNNLNNLNLSNNHTTPHSTSSKKSNKPALREGTA